MLFLKFCVENETGTRYYPGTRFITRSGTRFSQYPKIISLHHISATTFSLVFYWKLIDAVKSGSNKCEIQNEIHKYKSVDDKGDNV